MNEKALVEPVPEHGGRLRQAARQWDIPESQWLDLSTGINPNSWP
ncbi:MAG: threonine-phosphate decarboxylase, partial [Marinobacter sp. T13-3]